MAVGADLDPELRLAGAGGLDVERREDALLSELPVEAELHVARALELLEDPFVHPRARLDERARNDGKRAALLDIPRGAEEPAWRVQGGRVDAAGEDLPRRGHREVVGPRQPGQVVQQ